jgi:regulatory protein
MQKKFLTKEEAIQKMKHYCTYQERSQNEVKSKLYELGIRKADHDEIISALIEDNYLNEERFARQFVGGKFRMKDWGRKKIYYGLREKGVSEYLIRIAMKEIDEDEYQKVLEELAGKKWESLKGEDHMSRKRKTMDFLLQRGFESQLVTSVVNSFGKKE